MIPRRLRSGSRAWSTATVLLPLLPAVAPTGDPRPSWNEGPRKSGILKSSREEAGGPLE